MGRDGYVVPADPGAGAAMISASANVNVNVNLNLKKKNQSARSWILLDSRGEGTNLDVDKYAIMHRVHIHARDLRILDPLLSYPSTILGRDKAIVLNLEVTLLFFFFFFSLLSFHINGFFFGFNFWVFSISRQLSLLKRFVFSLFCLFLNRRQF